jgi:hypothetical protein
VKPKSNRLAKKPLLSIAVVGMLLSPYVRAQAVTWVAGNTRFVAWEAGCLFLVAYCPPEIQTYS